MFRDDSKPRREWNPKGGNVPIDFSSAADDILKPEGDEQTSGEAADSQAPELTEIEREIDRLQEELKAEQDRKLRAIADLQNYRRRTQDDMAQRLKYANEALLSDLIVVLDHFEMAVDAAEVNEQTQIVCKGYEMILQQLKDTMQRYGMEEIEAVEGMFFDPEYHEAVERIQTLDPCEGTVMKIVRKGYRYNDRILRPVQVAVAVPPDNTQG